MPNDDLSRGLGRVEGKLDSVIALIERHLEADDGIHEKHDDRIGKLERGRAYMLGVTAVVSGLATIFGSEIVSFIKGVLS